MRIEKTSLRKPLTAQLEITDQCNHLCEHCYNLDSDVTNRPHRKVDDETVLRCADALIRNEIFSVVVSGGEPLIKKGLTKKVITRFIENNIDVHLNSNIVLIDDDFIDFIAKNNITLLTSCPSSNSESFRKITGQDNYIRFEYNLKKLLSAGIRVAVNMVVTKTNKHEICKTAKDLISLGVRAFAATPMGLNVDYPRKDLLLDISEITEVVDTLVSIHKEFNIHVDIMEALPKCIFSKEVLESDFAFLKRRCQAGRNVISVSCNGDVRPCAHNNDVYGNILQDSIEVIWEKMRKWRENKFVPNKCLGCGYVDRCLGGCRTSAYAYNGEWDAPDFWSRSPLDTLPKKCVDKIHIKESDTYSVNTNIVFRKDGDDLYVVYNKKDDCYLMVNESLFSLIELLLAEGTSTFGSLMSCLNVSESSKSFQDTMNWLIKNRILLI